MMRNWLTRRLNGTRWLLAMLILGLLGFAAGCANDPASQKRIAYREAHINRDIERAKKSEARRPERLQKTMRDISRSQERKKAQYEEMVRTLGDRFW